MFDIGFSEILLVSIVTLLVVGPERIPETVRNVAGFVRRIRRSLFDIRSQIEQEINMPDIKQNIYNDKIKEDIEFIRESGQSLKQDLEGLGANPATPSIENLSVVEPTAEKTSEQSQEHNKPDDDHQRK